MKFPADEGFLGTIATREIQESTAARGGAGQEVDEFTAAPAAAPPPDIGRWRFRGEIEGRTIGGPGGGPALNEIAVPAGSRWSRKIKALFGRKQDDVRFEMLPPSSPGQA
jgi:hypothetical protein